MAEVPIIKNAKKRVFLGLLLIVLLLFMGIGFYLFILSSFPSSATTKMFLIVITVGVFIFLFLLLLGSLALLMMIMGKSSLWGLQWLIDKTLFFLYPLVIQVGRFLNIAQEKVQRSFIEVSNQLSCNRFRGLKSSQILVLLPHCLQKDECRHKITNNINNCVKCGSCQIGGILSLAERKGVRIEVVTGGTMARRVLERYNPQGVIAVACERDLSSGMLDSFPLPVIGLVNERPNGPCFNTRVDLATLEEILNLYCNNETENQQK